MSVNESESPDPWAACVEPCDIERASEDARELADLLESMFKTAHRSPLAPMGLDSARVLRELADRLDRGA